MTREAITLCIKRKELFDNPESIERLYLHNKGFVAIENLDSFTNLRELFLEENALKKIDKLRFQKRLKSLHLHNNQLGETSQLQLGFGGSRSSLPHLQLLEPRSPLERIDNLDSCLELQHLDVSNNKIAKINDLSSLRSLESLILKGNLLSKPDSIRNVIYINSLRELDISKNRINCSLESVLEVLSQCASLRILRLKGNPVAKTKHYRRLVVGRCEKLTHLDDDRICTEERRRCNAWGKVVARGGSFDEAAEADRRALIEMKAKISEANAARRGSRRPSEGDDGSSAGSSKSKAIGARLVGSMTRKASLVAALPSVLPRKSLRKELDRARELVESQREEIARLREQLGEKHSTEEVDWGSACDVGSVTDDSERDTSYSLRKNQQLARKANLKVQQMESLEVDASSGGNGPNLQDSPFDDFDPFSIMPPMPPSGG
ncbi:hypothetical protein ACHAWF_003200 [Thalassiosira exigua]